MILLTIWLFDNLCGFNSFELSRKILIICVNKLNTLNSGLSKPKIVCLTTMYNVTKFLVAEPLGL